jgi:hypothetical protein
MSATFIEISFGVTVEDHEHWSPQHLTAAEADPGDSYDEWVSGQLYEVMREAGNRFIAEHPDLFRSTGL